MELNPHIPKPDPPKEEETKEEEKKEEAADDNKKEEDKEKVCIYTNGDGSLASDNNTIPILINYMKISFHLFLLPHCFIV